MVAFYAACVTAIVISIALIVSRRALALDAKRELMKRSDNKLLEKEKKRLQKEFEDKEHAFCAIKEQELAEIENERNRLFIRLDTERQNLQYAKNYHMEQAEKYKEGYANTKKEVLRALAEPLRLDSVSEELFVDEFFGAKGERAVTQKMDFSILKVECEVFSRKSGYTYTTSLTSCSCRDYEKNKKDNAQYVCKHMLALAIHLNAFKVDPFIMTEKQAICAEREKEFIRNAKIAEEEYSSIAKELELLREEKSRYDKWQNDVRVDFPWIAETLAWMEERYDNIRIEALPKNASKARETTQALSKEKVALATRVGELEARLAAYDYFRLDRFKNISLDELRAIVGEKENPRDSGGPDLEGKQ